MLEQEEKNWESRFAKLLPRPKINSNFVLFYSESAKRHQKLVLIGTFYRPKWTEFELFLELIAIE